MEGRQSKSPKRTIDPVRLNPAMPNSVFLNCFSLPLAQITPGPTHLELHYVPKKHWWTRVTAPPDNRCTESWKVYWRVHGNESKVRLTGLTAANAEGDKLPVFVGSNYYSEKFDTNLNIPNPLPRTISRHPLRVRDNGSVYSTAAGREVRSEPSSADSAPGVCRTPLLASHSQDQDNTIHNHH